RMQVEQQARGWRCCCVLLGGSYYRRRYIHRRRRGCARRHREARHCCVLPRQLTINQLTSKRADGAFLCPGLGRVIGMQVENLSVGLVLRKVGEHANHRGRADARGNEDGGTIRILQDELAGGERGLDGIADFDVLPQVAGYFALCFYGNTVLTGVAADDGVLAKLAGAIGKLDADGGVLTWLWLGEVSFEYILGDAIGEDILFEYLCLAEHITWFN